MNPPNQPGSPIDPDHDQKRSTLRALGFLIAGLGLIFTLIGLGSFFSSFGSFQPPHFFWCAFVGLPLLGIGTTLIKAGYFGAAARYIAGESAPVAKDTFNYLADGTREGVKDVATAIGEGVAASRATASPTQVICRQCSETNDPNAQFCKHCGAPLARNQPCPTCHQMNAPDARFCDHCGRALTA